MSQNNCPLYVVLKHIPERSFFKKEENELLIKYIFYSGPRFIMSHKHSLAVTELRAPEVRLKPLIR